MKQKIDISRDENLKNLELRMPTEFYDQLVNSYFSDEECDDIVKLAAEIGVKPNELLYCGLRIIKNSSGDADIQRDCKEIVRRRR